MFLSSKPKVDPIEQAKTWKRNIEKEVRHLDRDITNIRRQEGKAGKEVKKLAKAGQMSSAKIIAKEIVQTRKAVERLYMAKAQLNSVAMSLQHTIMTIKMQGCLSKSTEIMSGMNKLVGIKEIRATMMELAKEMERSGLIEEVVNETFEAIEPDGTEASADSEVDRVIQELTAEMMAGAADAPVRAPVKPASVVTSEPEMDAEIAAMQARLNSL